ncbi:uncharacterized protein LOC111246019 [Varroa destructor]|uniref:PH domain-containing protein n=1 Tax=Varroa destructor TaxID=109461 RepID=A0A7M7M5K7_VARDE|nr:uncharacterized protein LOC111246019 [Varroa destructor]
MFDGPPSLTSTPGLNSLDDCEVLKKRRFLKRETKALKSQRSRSDGVAKMLPPTHIEDNSPSHQSQWNIIGTPNVRSTSSPGGPIVSQRSSMGGQFGEWRQRSPIVSQLGQSHTPTSQGLTPSANNGSPGKRSCHSNSVYLLMSDLGSHESQSANTSPVVTPNKLQTSNTVLDRKVKTLGSPPQQRGVPDGCPLDLDEDHVDGGPGSLHIGSLSPASALGPLGASSNQADQHHAGGGALLTKKGWLYLRQRYNGQVDWTRLWFVLRQGSFSQFTDPSAEEKGQARGTLDTRALRAATELDNADRNYAFALVWTPSGGEGSSRELVLSAATAAIRTNWLQAIRQAAAASNALAVAPVSSVGTHGLTLATVSSIGSSTASIASGLTSSSSPSSAGGSPGSAMLSGHSDNSRQFRRQLSPARTTTTTTSGPITSPVTTTESITHCTKEMTLPLGQEKTTPSKRLSNRALSNTGQVGSPCDSGGEGSYFSATDSTPTQETPHALTARHGGRVELPPSPVPNRNALSKAKHRARSSSAHSRVRSGLGSSQMSGEATASHSILDVTAASNTNVQQLEQKMSSLASGVVGASMALESEDEESSCGPEEDEADEADEDENEECLLLDLVDIDTIDGNNINSSGSGGGGGGQEQRLAYGHNHLSSRHGHSLTSAHQQGHHLQRQSHRGTTMHKIARAQALENKLRVARSDLEAKQAEIDALRRLVATSSGVPNQQYVTSRSIIESTISRSHEPRSLSPSRSCTEEVDDASRRAQELVSKSLQLLKNISAKTALKEVKEKCLDLQSHIVSLETLVGDVVEFANTTNANLKAAECGLPRAVPPKSNAAVQTASATQAERDEKLTKAQREIARLTKELIDSQKTADDAELQLVRVSNDMKMAAEEHRQQSALLNLRLDDLTSKLSASEKNAKLAKQKLARLEKRRLSLKGKDASLTLSKDIETKLSNLEAKMLFLEDMSTMTDSQSDVSEDLRSHATTSTPGLAGKQPVNRRFSTDSQNSETNTSAHRIYHLDQKVKAAVEAAGGMPMKAKLYLQSRTVKDPIGIEEWQTGPLGALGTASLSASMTDLTELTMDPGLDPSCSSISSMSPYECLEMLSQRVDSLLCWFTSSLQGLRRAAEDAPWCRLLGQLLELIDHLSCACDRVPGSLQGRGASDKASLGLAYNLLLLQETARAVRMVNDTDRDLRHSLHGSARQMHRVLASFNASLSRNCFTADAIFEGLQQGLRATEQGGSASLVEDFVSGPIDPIAALGDAVAQVKAQFDCAAFKVADYKRGKRSAIQESLARLLANHSRRGYEFGSVDMGDYNNGSCPEAWDACACVARQEALLSRVTEAIARVSTSVGFYLDKSLGHGSTLLINFDKMPEPGQMKALIADALQTDIDLLNYELRKDCIEVLDVSVFGDSATSRSSATTGVGALVDDSVMSAMETEILPEVNEVVTLICVFAIFKGYLAYLEQQSLSSSCLAETFRRISSPPIANSDQANTTAFRGSGNSATSGNSSSALTAGGAPSIASSAQVLESVHSKFFEMLLMLNGTSDVPQAVERWLACVVNSSHGSSPGEHMSSSLTGGGSFGQNSAQGASADGIHSSGSASTSGAHLSSATAVGGGDCGLIIPSLTATVTSAIGRVQAKLAREQDAQKDALNSLRQRLEQVERERSGCDRSMGSSGLTECSGCERLKRQLENLTQQSDSGRCENCHRLEKQLQEQTSCAECPTLLSRLEEYEAALSAGCPGCERLEKEIEAMEMHMAEQDDAGKRSKLNSDQCNSCEELQRALDAARNSYDARVANLQADLESRLREQLQIGEEIHIHRLPRWQNELEQVRQLCDKGIGLLQESHAAELARLCENFETKLKAERAEKERIIAEETRATQVALEAIQRQHRSHIEELKANMKPSGTSCITQDKEKVNASNQEAREVHAQGTPVSNERVLNEIREDIVNLSEKFSKKCVEAAAVQERLYTTQKQLQKANTQLFDLLATRARSDTPLRHPTNASPTGLPSSLSQTGAQPATSPSKHSPSTRP